MIRDRLVLGVANTRLRERLLREDNLDLEKAVNRCQAAEATERQIQSVSTDKGRVLSISCVTATFIYLTTFRQFYHYPYRSPYTLPGYRGVR